MKLKKGTIKTVSWRLNVPQGLPERYQLIASVAGVPVDQLVTHVLDDWTRKNRSLLMDDSMPARLKSLISMESTSKQSK